MSRLSPAHESALARMEDLDFIGAAELLAKDHAGDWIARNDLALCRFALGDTETALNLLDEILQHDPGNGLARLNRFYVAETAALRARPAPEPLKKVRETRGDGPASPLVTVVMPTFNRPDLIRESIQSVLAQSLGDLELIIVNDGGEREVERTVREYLGDGRVRYALSEHGGLSSARNVGMALAKGRFIAQLDDDDVYYPDHLETVAGWLRDHPEVKVAYGDCNRAYQQNEGGRWVTKEKRVAYGIDFDLRAMRHQSYVPVISFIHERSCIEQVGYYNEGILRAMDWEYLIRLGKRFPFQRIARPTCEQRERADRSQMTRVFTIPRNYYRNLICFLHGFFPLTGRRLLETGQGRGERLQKALDRLMIEDRDEFFLRRLELRKLLVEPYYAMFYTLGKRLSEEGEPARARSAFRAALAIRPYEIKAWSRWLRSGKEVP